MIKRHSGLYGVRNAVKRLCVTWYENINSDVSTWDTRLSQVANITAGYHRNVNPSTKEGINGAVALWETEYSEYQKAAERFAMKVRAWKKLDPDCRQARPKSPEEVPSPRARFLASCGKALQVVDSMLAYLELPHHVIPQKNDLYMVTSGSLNFGCSNPIHKGSRPSSDTCDCRSRYGYPLVPDVRSERLIQNLFELFLGYSGLYILGRFEMYYKTKLSLLESYSKKQSPREQPPVPDLFHVRFVRSKNIYGGKGGHALGRWLCSDPVRCQEFVFNMKRCAPKADDDQLFQEGLKSATIITTPPVERPFLVPTGVDAGRTYTIEDAKHAVRRTCQELFGGLRFPVSAPHHLPSSKAHYLGSGHSVPRSLGGARGNLQPYQMHEEEALLTVASEIGLRVDIAPDRREIIDHIVLQKDDDILRRLLRYFRPPNEEISALTPVFHWFELGIEKIVVREMSNRIPLETPCELPAKVHPLAEPLKIRTITAGPPREYYHASYIQKWLHGILRKTRTFTLIGGAIGSQASIGAEGNCMDGRPITEHTVQSRFREPLRDGQFYVSGDYKAATNLIHGALSATVAEEISRICEIPDEYAKLFLVALTGHQIEFGPEFSKKQMNGQLMGSPVSFPVLCIINAALTRDSQEISGDIPIGTSLDDFPCLINGDDVVFPSTDQGYEIWKGVTSCGGLVPSLGKNFTSPKFLVMNSVMFRVGKVEQPRPMRSSGRRYDPGLTPVPIEPSMPRLTQITIETLHVSTGAMSEVVELTHCSSPYFLKPLHSTTNRPVRDQQTFTTAHWWNMDYLGPSGRSYRRAVPWESVKKKKDLIGLRMKQLETFCKGLCKKSRFHGTLNRLSDLFQSDGYQVLPGLQRCWLGPTTGGLRRAMNHVFLDSWKDVLALASCTPREALLSGIKGCIPFSTDWFLPTQLGGLGLESVDGVRSSSVPARRLAKYLLENPSERMPVMPTLGETPNFAYQARRDLMSQIQEMEKRGQVLEVPTVQPCPSGFQEITSLISLNTRRLLLQASGNTLQGPEGDFALNMDRTIQLGKDLERVYATRRRWWGAQKRLDWYKCAPLTQRELEKYLNIRKVVAIEPVPVPHVLFTRSLPEEEFHSARPEYLVPSGRLFPLRQRLRADLEEERLAFYAEECPPLPDSWPIYIPTELPEWNVMSKYRMGLFRDGREAAKEARIKRRNFVELGRQARRRGEDLFGDDEFDVLITKME